MVRFQVALKQSRARLASALWRWTSQHALRRYFVVCLDGHLGETWNHSLTHETSTQSCPALRLCDRFGVRERFVLALFISHLLRERVLSTVGRWSFRAKDTPWSVAIAQSCCDGWGGTFYSHDKNYIVSRACDSNAPTSALVLFVYNIV